VQRRVEAGLRRVEVSGQQAIVKLLDVEQFDLEIEAARIDRPGENPVEGEGVVGTRRDAELMGMGGGG